MADLLGAVVKDLAGIVPASRASGKGLTAPPFSAEIRRRMSFHDAHGGVMAEEKCDLASKKCSACTKETPALTDAQVEELLPQVPKWQRCAIPGYVAFPERTGIFREFVLKDFDAAVAFISAIGAVAKGENHHPEIHLHSYRRVKVMLVTRAILDLSENDFIVAAKIDALAEELGK
jgi:4a-hydroxytetrahydrobiopterin dehydratase